MIVTRVTNAIAARPGVRAAQLRIVDGPDRGLELDVPAAGISIGTEKTCDVVLSDFFVSRRHCTIAPVAQGFAITDLGSRNGTVIDGVAVGKVVAPPGGALCGASIVMRHAFAVLERASKSTASVLFLGERAPARS